MVYHSLLTPYVILTLFFSAFAHAQDNVDDLGLLYQDESSVSIATGSEKPLHLAPSVASVITAKEIKASGATTLAEALERVPGLHVYPSSLNRLNPSFSIRGIHTGENPQVLVLIDGMALTDPYSGNRGQTFRLPTEGISRIEIIRGPGSAVYGADAFAGVINIITKSPIDIENGEIGARIGSFNSKDAWTTLRSKHAGWNIGGTLQLSTSDGDKGRVIPEDFQSSFDAQYGTSASLAPGPLKTNYNIITGHIKAIKNDLTLKLWGWNQISAGLGAGGAQALDTRGSQDYSQYIAGVRYDIPDWINGWSSSINYNFLYQSADAHLVLLPSGALVPIGSDGNLGAQFDPSCPYPMNLCLVRFTDGLIANVGGDVQQHFIEFSTTGTYNGTHKLRFATGFKYQGMEPRESKNFGPGVITGLISPIDGTLTNVSGTDNIFIKDTSRNIWHISLQDEWQLAPDWELTAGVRYDHYSDFGNTVNPRLALVWATNYNLTTKMLYGRAFRAPTFSELESINNPVILGNPNLEPETIDTYEIAFDYRPAFDWKINLSLFHYKIDGLIDFVGASTKTAQNANDQEAEGIEIQINWEATNNLRLTTNAAIHNAKNSDTGDEIADAPRKQFYIASQWEFHPNWQLYGQAYWIGNRPRAPSDTRGELDDYALFDLTLRYDDLSKPWSAAILVKNLFDQNAKEPASSSIPGDYPIEGRAIFAEARFDI